MRLVAVSPTGLFSGAEQVLLRLLAAGSAAGLDISCTCPAGPLAERLAGMGAAAVAIPDLKLPPGPAPVALGQLGQRQLRAAVTLRRHVRVGDVVLINGLMALPAVWPLRRRARLVWLVHDVIIRSDRLAILRAFGRTVDLAVAVSQAVAQPLVQVGVSTRVIRNGTPWPVDPLPAPQPVPPVVGCNGLLTSWKGQDVLLEAVAGMARRDVRVQLLGGQFPKDASYVDSLRRRAARPDLAGRIDFLGHVEDPLAAMRNWTVAVSSSVEPEAVSLAVLEAMSLGLPVVATNHGGVPEFLDGAGLLVPPADAVALTAALDRLVGEPSLWAELHTAGPSRIKEGLRLEDQMRALLDVIREVGGAGRGQVS